MMRIGHGYDVHRLLPNRKLLLCGVHIPHRLGLEGHSDADVATHAAIDAILGAAALGDIGSHYPDDEIAYENADSTILLTLAYLAARRKGYQVENIDFTIIAQEPKLQDYIPQMRKRMSEVLMVDIDQVSVKATTEEGLGFSGREEGIATHCVVLLGDRKPKQTRPEE